MDHGGAGSPPRVAVVLRTSRGLTLRGPNRSSITAMVEALPRDSHLVLERDGESGPDSHYFQVWLRLDGTYQVEYRDGSPERHFQSRTISREKVVDALADWAAAGDDWRGSFDWTNIAEYFH